MIQLLLTPILALTVAAAITFQARAGSIFKSSTVKIISSFNNQSVTFRGSGLAFQYTGQAYVVTSDHVVLHDNDEKKHRIVTSNGVEADCEFLLSDFGRGLALLKVKSNVDFSHWPSLDTLALTTPAQGSTAAMMGYPAMSNGLVRDVSGKVSDPQKLTDLFVQVDKLVEIQGGHAEFGMSGGVVADSGDGFIGILSHQIYQQNTGPIQNTILAIPSATVVQWLKDYFVDPAHPLVTLVQLTVQQNDHNDVDFASGSLNFAYLDAFGSGRRVIDILKLSQNVSALYASKNGDLARYQTLLQSRDDCQIYIMGFRSRGLVDAATYGTGDLVTELRTFENPALEPLTELSCNDSDDIVDHLGNLHDRIDTLGRALPPTVSGELLSTVETYLQYIDHQDEYADSVNYYLLKAYDIEALLSAPRYAADWKKLEQHSATQTSTLRALLIEWAKDLHSLSI